MKTPSRRLLCVFVLLSAVQFAGADDPKRPAGPPEINPHWRSIHYPSMTPWRKVITQPGIFIENKGEDGMKLNFYYYLPSWAEQKKRGNAKPETMEALLYRNQEKPQKLSGTFRSEPYSGSGPATIEGRELSTEHVFAIPWGPNAFDDAWVLLSLKDRNFWVELPYGFTRNPDDPQAPAEKDRGFPPFPAPKGGFGHHDLVIPWEYVSYPLGKFKNDGEADLNLSNPFDAMAELSLWKFEGDVRSPQSAVTFVYAPEYEHEGGCISLTLGKTIDPCRQQMFAFGRAPNEGRHWCLVRVKIGDEERTLRVPSSILFYVHGHADVPEKLRKLELGEKWQYNP